MTAREQTRTASPYSLVTALLTTLAAMSLVALAVAPAAAGISVLVEAEDYVDYYDMGGASVMVVGCSGASQGLAVDGIDISGEWLEMKATVTDEACYDLVLSYQAIYQDFVELALTVFDEGHTTLEAESGFRFYGAGIGWGPFSETAGSGPICLKAGTYVLRLELVTGMFILPDFVQLVATQTTVDPFDEELSWGAIKSLYR